MNRTISSIFVLFVFFLYPVPNYAFESWCSQPSSVRESLMRQAEQNQFTLRRAEFVGLTYTRDDLVRPRMSFNEGDFFTRRKLVLSLRNMSKLRREFYPVRISDVKVRLDELNKTIDLTICFKSKRR